MDQPIHKKTIIIKESVTC